MAPRICPVCKLAFREGSRQCPIRIKPEDGYDIEHGLYAACNECMEKLKAIRAKRLGVPVESITEEQLM